MEIVNLAAGEQASDESDCIRIQDVSLLETSCR